MTLLDLHVELAITNTLLKRIADALDRAVPIIAPPDHSAHPLIGLSDVSHLSREHFLQKERDRATLPFRASERVFSGPSAGGSSSINAGAGAGAASAGGSNISTTSVVGQWDHDDPLDTLDDFDHDWPNYAGMGDR